MLKSSIRITHKADQSHILWGQWLFSILYGIIKYDHKFIDKVKLIKARSDGRFYRCLIKFLRAVFLRSYELPSLKLVPTYFFFLRNLPKHLKKRLSDRPWPLLEALVPFVEATHCKYLDVAHRRLQHALYMYLYQQQMADSFQSVISIKRIINYRRKSPLFPVRFLNINSNSKKWSIGNIIHPKWFTKRS